MGAHPEAEVLQVDGKQCNHGEVLPGLLVFTRSVPVEVFVSVLSGSRNPENGPKGVR